MRGLGRCSGAGLGGVLGPPPPRWALSRTARRSSSGPNHSKEELNSEIWGKGVCDIREKWVSGWRMQIYLEGVQQRFEVLDVEHHAVGSADGMIKVVPAVRVHGELAQGLGPLLELYLVGQVVVRLRARRLRHHPEERQRDDD